MKQKFIQIDREKLREAVRRLGNEQVFCMLNEAIEMLAPPKLLSVALADDDFKDDPRHYRLALAAATSAG